MFSTYPRPNRFDILVAMSLLLDADHVTRQRAITMIRLLMIVTTAVLFIWLGQYAYESLGVVLVSAERSRKRLSWRGIHHRVAVMTLWCGQSNFSSANVEALKGNNGGDGNGNRYNYI